MKAVSRITYCEYRIDIFLATDRITREVATGPLVGMRVAEICSSIAGPVCTRLLADFGAEVMKIEALVVDGLREMWKNFDDVSQYAATILRQKKLVAIDLKSIEGRTLVVSQ